MTASAIEISDLRMRYGSALAVDRLDLTVAAGSMVAVLGPNGAGKTTTLETVAGLRVPGAGAVRVHGHDPIAERDAVRELLAIQPQDAALPPHLRVGEALDLWKALYPDGLDVADLVPLLGVDDLRTSAVDRLSGGQRRRLAIVLTLLADRPVLLLDEPTAELDPLARAELWDAVRSRHADGRTVVVTTHLIEEAEELADRVVVIDRGRVLADGTAGELCAATGTDRLADAYRAVVTDRDLTTAPTS